ncbi:MAG: type II secretion system F family protein [Propionibacteriaceae bacterium]|jgi:pilus assembly protein TadC|nr:type II secretion system F family protein [Propionibacteriaceae bacterium]
MTAVVLVAAVCAGLSLWWGLPDDVVVRLRPRAKLRLPAWLEPAPGAMASRQRWWIALGVTVIVVAVGWDGAGWIIAAAPLIATAVWVGLGRLESSGQRQRRQAILVEIPGVLDLIQSCVRAGQPLRNATQVVVQTVGSPVGDLLSPVIRAIDVGMTDEQAWGLLVQDPVVGFCARDLARSSAWGTSTSDLLAGHAATLRRAGRSARLTAAKSVGVKAVIPLGLCYLPAFMLLGVAPIIAAGVGFLF